MNNCPIVVTSLGKIKGAVVKNVSEGKEVLRYSRVPFAKPPVGELRFESPVKPEPWSGILDGTKRIPFPQQDTTSVEMIDKYIPLPPTDGYELNEDCLYLTVYTTSISQNANLPVMLWIYGGGFNTGCENGYDGSVLSGLHDVVVVIPNYRVSIFGFLALGKDSECPGNVGLLDQIMAMKWCREHIHNFGGNPKNITIFGQSGGGMSVNYHVLSPLSAGYFDKAISHSGSAFTEGFTTDNGDLPVAALKEELKITETDNRKLVKILKSLPAEDIVKAVKTMTEKMAYFSPVVDGKFLPKDIETLAKENANTVPYIAGFNNTEGHGLMSLNNPKGFADGITKETCSETLKGLVGYFLYKGLPDAAYNKMLDEYSKGVADEKMKWSRVYGDIMRDLMFANPALKSLKAHHAFRNTTYVYVMSQQPQFNHDSKYGPETARKVPVCDCDHGDDLLFTFGIPLYKGKLTFDAKFTEDEKTLSREWMKYLTNFARNGDDAPPCV